MGSDVCVTFCAWVVTCVCSCVCSIRLSHWGRLCHHEIASVRVLTAQCGRCGSVALTGIVRRWWGLWTPDPEFPVTPRLPE